MIKRRVNISSFLTEREDRFKPEEANKLGLMRVNKIDFSGEIHLVEHKPTRTNMILVKKGDLLISGINAEKGAIAVYEYDEDAIATIHYSSYSYNDELIDIEYLKWFLKSNVFRNILIEQAGNGIKSELKAKKFLKLEIDLPELNDQVEFVHKMASVNEEIKELNNLIQENETLLTKLRQSILQDAIEGKLTTEWRKQNPDVESSCELLKRIIAEKDQLIKEKKIKRAKESGEILKNEFNREFPTNWTTAKIVDLCFVTKLAGFEYTKHIDLKDTGDVPVIRAQNVKSNRIDETNLKFIDKKTSLLLERCALTKPSILMTFIGAGIGDTAVFNKKERWHLAPNVAKLEPFNNFDLKLNINFLQYYFMSPIGRSEIFKHVKATAQPNLSMGTIRDSIVILPPIKEQLEIVKLIDTLFELIESLNHQINDSIHKSEPLLQAILSELLGEENKLIESLNTEIIKIIPSREIKYNSKTTFMELVELLKTHGSLHAEDLWRMSKQYDDRNITESLDKFYTELKRQIEKEKTIKEGTEKGYLELA